MNMPRIDHIGIIVPDLKAAIARFCALLDGLVPERRDLPEVGLCIAEFQTSNLRIELIAYDGAAELARRVMGSDTGINHLSLSTNDMDNAVGRLTAASFRVQTDFPRRGARGTVAFLERDAATGLLFEICAPTVRRRVYDAGGHALERADRAHAARRHAGIAARTAEAAGGLQLC